MTSLTTASAVAGYLGVTFSTAESAQATALLTAADATIQNYCGRNWLFGAITDEVYTPDGPLLYLRQRPVTSIQNVKGRLAFNSTPTTLVANTDYEARDLSTGLLILGTGAVEWPPRSEYTTLPIAPRQPWSFPYAFVTVSYTPTSTVPADVAHAATMLIASWMDATLTGGDMAPGASVIAVKTADLETRYSPGTTDLSGDLPAGIKALLRPYASPLVFA